MLLEPTVKLIDTQTHFFLLFGLAPRMVILIPKADGLLLRVDVQYTMSCYGYLVRVTPKVF
jgi:hypothetical protein